MKHARKLASLLLALVMVFALATTAFAAGNATISAPKGSTRAYDVYQIFTGDLHEGVLSNIKWGKNGTGTEGDAVDQATLDALAAVNGKSNTEKLAEIQKYVKLDSEKFGTVSNGNQLEVPTGYYLIKDNGPVNAGEDYSLYVVEVVGPTTISPKVGTTTSNKKYYVQYAHARICSIIKALAKDGITPRKCTNAELALLTAPEEKELIHHLASYTNEIESAAKDYDPTKITRYVTQLATLFHKFYNACRVKGEDEALTQARLALCESVKVVIKNVLTMFNISCPESM